MSLQKREYQIKGKAALYESIRNGNKRILWVFPTGGGKSTMASDVTKDCIKAGKRVLFMVHSKELVQQFAQRLRSQYRINSAIIMAGHPTDYSQPVQVASVQTLVRREAPKADLIFIDESHRAKANTYEKILAKYPGAIIVGLTATPFRTDGKGLGDIFEDIVHPVKIRELIDLGFLVPTQCYVPAASVDMSGVKMTAGDYNKKQMAEKYNDHNIISGAVENYRKFADGKKAIVFCVNVELSKTVCDRFKEQGISSAQLDGTSDKEERRKMVQQFADGKIRVLVNCQIFTEGFDIPDTEVVILMRSTKSLGMYVQMVGRGLRPAPGKTECIVIDHGRNVIEHGFVENYDLAPFSLDTTKPKKETEPKCKTCKSCESVVDRFASECECCGAVFEKKERAVKMGELGEFVAVDKDAITLSRIEGVNWKKKLIPPHLLRIYRHHRGYKKGWMAHYAIEKGYVGADFHHPQFWQILNKELTMAEVQAGTRQLTQQVTKFTQKMAA